MTTTFPDHPLIDIDRRSFLKDSKWQRASPRIWEVFTLLALRCDGLVTRDQIQEWVYGDEPGGGIDPKSISYQIMRLRTICPFTIETIHSYGYILSGYKAVRRTDKVAA